MNNSGRHSDVIIEKNYRIDLNTGVELGLSSLFVWTEEGNDKLIEEVEGAYVMASGYYNGMYIVQVDARYDSDVVGKNIEHIILTKGK